FAPIMDEVRKFAASGGLVIGICNGFQILCEAGLLPAALLRNPGLKYICKFVDLRVENADRPFTNICRPVDVLHIPIGLMDVNYYCEEATLETLKRQKRIVFRYSTPDGQITGAANPNGSLDNIAGICSEGRNVMGMMPHPDRSSEALLGSSDGAKIFKSMATSLVPIAR